MSKISLCLKLSAFLFMAAQTGTFAAIPFGTVVLGNNAYSLNYANNKSNEKEIQEAVASSFNRIYIKDFNGNWVDNISNKVVEKSMIPAVTYKSEKETKNFDKCDCDDNIRALFDFSLNQSAAVGQSLVKVGEITLSAGDCDVQITGLKLTRSGLSSDSYIKRITIWDGFNRLNSYGELSNNVSDISFLSPITISKGQSKTLSIKVSIGNTAVPGSQIKLSIIDKNDIKSTKDIIGIFPAVSGTITIVPAP